MEKNDKTISNSLFYLSPLETYPQRGCRRQREVAVYKKRKRGEEGDKPPAPVAHHLRLITKTCHHYQVLRIRDKKPLSCIWRRSTEG